MKKLWLVLAFIAVFAAGFALPKLLYGSKNCGHSAQMDCCKKDGSCDRHEKEGCCKKEGKTSGKLDSTEIVVSGASGEAKACCKKEKAECCKKTDAGDVQACCKKHRAGDVQECCKGHDA